MYIYIYICVYALADQDVHRDGPALSARSGEHNCKNGVVAKTARRQALHRKEQA